MPPKRRTRVTLTGGRATIACVATGCRPPVVIAHPFAFRNGELYRGGMLRTQSGA